MSAIPSSTGLADMPGTTLPQAESGKLDPLLPLELIEEGKGRRRKYCVGFRQTKKEERLETADPPLFLLLQAVENLLTAGA